jgi:alpha-L-arabinofuranosidase
MTRTAARYVFGLALLVAAAAVLVVIFRPKPSGISAVAQVKVDATQQLAPVGDIIGAVVNEHYWGPTDPVHPDWHDDYLGRTIEPVRALAPANGRKIGIRFGHTPTDGSWGRDGYDWLEAFDPKAWATSIDEFMEYADRVGAEPYVAVNFGSGTAREAASFVAYVNGTDPEDPNVRLRIERGRTEPYNVTHWIIGFEPYAQWETGYRDDRAFDYANPKAENGGDPAWHGRPSSDPADYAERAAEYARAMRAASPTAIRLYAPLNNWDLAYYGGGEASVNAIVPALADLVDGLAIHFYPANTGYGQDDDDLLGRPESLAERIGMLRALLARHGPRAAALEIVDVEFNNASQSNDQTHQLVNGLFVADTLRVFAEKGVTSGFYFAISAARGNGSGFTLFEQGDVERPMPTYLAMQLVARHLGTEAVETTVARSKMVTAKGGKAGPLTYPSLTTLASLSPDRRTLYLVVVNKHLVLDQSAEIDLRGARPTGSATITRLSGSSPRATADGVRLSETQHQLSSPSVLGSMLDVLATQVPYGQTSFSLSFPAYSVTGIEIPLAAPVPN